MLFSSFLEFILNCFSGTIIIMVYGLPWMILVLAPLVPVYHWLQELYRLTSRELKRLSSVTLSPVYNHFSETLLGLPTIRSLRAVPRSVGHRFVCSVTYMQDLSSSISIVTTQLGVQFPAKARYFSCSYRIHTNNSLIFSGYQGLFLLICCDQNF